MPRSAADPLSPGAHTLETEGLDLRYHVHGAGPVCLAHPGGPGIAWGYLRSPALEERLTMVYLEPAGTGDSGRLSWHPHGYTRERYSRHLAALIDHLGEPQAYLLGHSHGGFVAQYHALNRPERLAGVILYESAPLTGPEHIAEARRQLELFAARHEGNPELESVLSAFAAVPTISDDAQMQAVVRGLLPAYFADYWRREEEFAPLRESVRTTYISGLDENGTPDSVDDRDVLRTLTLPTLVIAGLYDVICGAHWGEQLHELIPGSHLEILERSGHFGHLEESERFAQVVAAFAGQTRPAPPTSETGSPEPLQPSASTAPVVP